jgi:hypothetical protein
MYSSSDGSDSDEEDQGVILGSALTKQLVWKPWSEEKEAPEELDDISPSTKNLPQDMSGFKPIDFVHLLLPKRFWTGTRLQTNLYAEAELNRGDFRERGRGRKWTAATTADIFGFVGSLLVMSLYPLPATPEFFRDSGMPSINAPSLRPVMSLMRFEQIKRYFHLVDNTKRVPLAHPEHDRLFHVRPLLDCIGKTFPKYYKLGCYVSVDESMVPFKGRSFMKQYIKDKPTKWGFKLWAMCCPSSGYFYSVCVYAGKGSTEHVHGLATDSVLDVVDRGDVRKGSVIFTDRWFSSPLLIFELSKRGCFGVGTVQLNRSGLPAMKMNKSTKTNPIPAGTSYKFRSRFKLGQRPFEMYACTWMDKKPVAFLGSAFGLKADTCKRTVKHGRGVKNDIAVPRMAKMYQEYMGGVDRGDQLKMQYGLVRSIVTFKPWMKLFIGILDIVLANAWVLFKLSNPDTTETHRGFLKHVAEGFLCLSRGGAEHVEYDKTSRQACPRIIISMGKSRQCVHHNYKKVRKETSAMCKNCKVPLCKFGECSYKYHTMKYKVHGKSDVR